MVPRRLSSRRHPNSYRDTFGHPVSDAEQYTVSDAVPDGHHQHDSVTDAERHTVADAVPDQPLQGEVTKVGVLPDSQNRWMSPDLKVYLTTISIEGTKDWLKPGMTAKVEIMVDHLNDVIYVPLQAVTALDGHQVCHVSRGAKTEPRTVEIGQFNDEFIEIKSGLKVGEKVLLRPPDAATRGEDKAKPAAPAAKPATATPKPA